MKTWKTEQKPIVIIQKWTPLSDDEITAALRGNEGAQWWRAIVQLIEGYRSDNAAAAPTWAATNNALGMALNNGAHQVLSELLRDLQQREANKEG